MTRSLVSSRQAQKYAEDADQVEFDAFRSGSAITDSGVYDERVAGIQDDLAADAPNAHGSERWNLVDLTFDDSVGHVHEEIQRRADALEDAYPFALRGSELVYAERPRRIYEFLLSVSLSPSLSNGEYVGLPRTFERIVARLVASYFGRNARSMHIGFPRDDQLSFEGAARRLHEQTGAWVWCPDDDGLDPMLVKDEGCDFVVWLEPSDRRKIGQLFILGQCACGNDWQDKLDDLNVEVMNRWFNPLSTVPPVRSFATPRHVADDMLRESSRRTGLFFDRARLALIARSAGSDFFDAGTTARMDSLIDLVCGGDL